MNGVGRKEDREAGWALMQSLEASTLQKRQPWYLEALSLFLEEGTITAVQADAIKPYIGQPIEDIMHLETPYDKAKNAGVIDEAQSRRMNDYIFEKAHSGTALCSGTASQHFTKDATLSDAEFSTDKRNDSVCKASNGATVTMTNVKIYKSGDTTDHTEGSFTGLNAAVLAEGGSFIIQDSEIVSDAIGGNNVFAHGTGSHITLKNVLLDAYGAASNRCIFVSFGGEVEAEGCEFISRGSISSTVATDTGGGAIRLKDCLVKTLGGHCASLYSTGRIEAEHCVCVAPETEGIIIVGGNSITLKDTHIFSGQSQGVKFAADIEEDTGSFTMIGGSLSVCEGPVVASQGKANMLLDHVAIANPDGKAILGLKPMLMPGMEPPKDAAPEQIHVVLRNQTLTGEISGDVSCDILLEVTEGSVFKGRVSQDCTAKVKICLSADSRLILTGDTVLSEFENEDLAGNNIEYNGFALK